MSKELLFANAQSIGGGVKELKAIIEAKNQQIKDKQAEVDAAKMKLVDFERDEPEQITTITNLRADLAAKEQELSNFATEIDNLNGALAAALSPVEIEQLNAFMTLTNETIAAAKALQ